MTAGEHRSNQKTLDSSRFNFPQHINLNMCFLIAAYPLIQRKMSYLWKKQYILWCSNLL